MILIKELLDILVCPQCGGAVVPRDDDGLVCPACCLCYPLRDGIPVLLVEEAERIG